ncbi:hypothetical protein [Sphingopyxis sp.]|jgi:hypothetical protein|uniref:hypothetical protein n=1 Tax=Sphingopyxis sp. TaxID=1908224 RepID=UPI0025FF163E|nr:hypothetical protein [Sphingopyxis sp.]MBK6414879.1 hypothetical protein [Sphingopyxis sp.]
MSNTSDFYQAQADKCAVDAAASTLSQVRDRNLRAEQAWRTMAERLVQTEATRARQVAATAAKAEANAEAAAMQMDGLER